MITSVSIKNFRSIESMELSLGKINVLTGANNSGKSSVIYALLALKNAVTNPNQSLDKLFDLGFINLGVFRETVYRKQESSAIRFSIESDTSDGQLIYQIWVYANSTLIVDLILPDYEVARTIPLHFPVQGDTYEEIESESISEDYRLLWNGFTVKKTRKKGVIIESQEQGRENLREVVKTDKIVALANEPLNNLSRLDNIPIRRGFTKPQFNPASSQPYTEDEIATILYYDRELASDVAHFLEKIVARRFSVVPVANTTNFYLQTRDEKTGFTADLVNEGLGTNQLVTILAKALYKNASFICIDEPEIHLHPSIIDKLVNVLIDIANERGKQFLISTHSEHFITALLTAVVKKRISPEEIKVYHLTKDGWDTKAQEQKINEEGQIEGGLAAFYAAELNDWTSFFKTEE